MAIAPYGSLNLGDSLQALRISNATLVQYGMDDIWTAVSAQLNAHNTIIAEQLAMFASPTSMRLIRYGLPQSKSMEELAEYGIAQGQKARGGSEIGFPLRRYGGALSWNGSYFHITTARDFAKEVDMLMDADSRKVAQLLQQAFYLSTNYTFVDRFIDGASLPIKRLVNADSAALPIGPNGQEYDASTHTHYLARVSTFAQSDLQGLLDTVTEHFTGGDVKIIINSSNETAVRAFADFVPMSYFNVQLGDDTTKTGGSINAFNSYNRQIGVFRGAEVWVKPWAIANYILCVVTGSGVEPVLAARVRGTLTADGQIGSALPSIISGGSDESGFGDLTLVSDNPEYPMIAKQYVREIGFGVRNRVAAGVLYVGGTSYTNPTISAS